MTDQDAYRRYTAKAEELLNLAATTPLVITVPEGKLTREEAAVLEQGATNELGRPVVAMPRDWSINTGDTLLAAQAYATLALAAAQDRVRPFDAPRAWDTKQCPIDCGHDHTTGGRLTWKPCWTQGAGPIRQPDPHPEHTYELPSSDQRYPGMRADCPGFPLPQTYP